MTEQTFQQRYGSWAVVAGASEGLGAAFSRCIAARGLNVILLGRRIKPLLAAADAIRARYNVEVQAASLDLASPNLREAFAQQIEGREIGLLVYNAAYSSIAPYNDIPLEDKLRHVDVNCRGPVILTSVLAPPMIERKRGGIILMSSAASLRGTGLLATYAASKAFNTILAESLWQEFRPSGVDVLGVIAGATRTPNYEKSQPSSVRFSPAAQDPDSLAENALKRLGKGYPIWTSTWQVGFAAFLLNRLLPRSAGVRFLSGTTRQTYRNRLDDSPEG